MKIQITENDIKLMTKKVINEIYGFGSDHINKAYDKWRTSTPDEEYIHPCITISHDEINRYEVENEDGDIMDIIYDALDNKERKLLDTGIDWNNNLQITFDEIPPKYVSEYLGKIADALDEHNIEYDGDF